MAQTAASSSVERDSRSKEVIRGRGFGTIIWSSKNKGVVRIQFKLDLFNMIPKNVSTFKKLFIVAMK